MEVMSWLLLATGFTGGLTLVFLRRWLRGWLFLPPSLSAHFSPKGGCTETVVNELRLARREVYVQAYSFTSKPIAEALLAARKRGVHVEVLLDHSNEQEQYTMLHVLTEGGVKTLIDAQHPIAHNKVMVIDRRVVVTGSFNFTNQAEGENAENLLVIRGYPELARQYREHFESHRGHSRAPGAASAAKGEHTGGRKAA